MSNIAKEQFKLISKTSHISEQQEKAQDSNNTYSICLGTFGLYPLYKLGIYCIGKYNLFRFFFLFWFEKISNDYMFTPPHKNGMTITQWQSYQMSCVTVMSRFKVILWKIFMCFFLENLLLLDKIEQIRLWSKTFRRLKKLTRFIVL